MWVITRVAFSTLFFLGIAIPAQASLLYPTVQDVVVDQGEESRFEMVVQNQNSDTRMYTIDFIGVELGALEGEYSFFDLNQEQSSWFSSELQSFSLISGELREFGITVNPNESTASQSFVAGVRVVESPQSDSDLAVETGFLTLVFVTIGDGISEDVDWLSFESDRTVSLGNVVAHFTVRNSGDRFVQHAGIISLVSWTGQTTEIYDINPESKRVAKGQDRTFSIDVESSWAFGPYELKLETTPWIGGEIHSDSVTVWFFSPKTTALIILGLIGLIIIWRYAKRR